MPRLVWPCRINTHLLLHKNNLVHYHLRRTEGKTYCFKLSHPIGISSNTFVSTRLLYSPSPPLPALLHGPCLLACMRILACLSGALTMASTKIGRINPKQYTHIRNTTEKQGTDIPYMGEKKAKPKLKS